MNGKQAVGMIVKELLTDPEIQGRLKDGGTGLAKQWRPITMLVFVALIAGHWFGYTPENLPPDQVEMILQILEVALWGYIGGRTIEKVSPSLLSTLRRQGSVAPQDQ